MFKFIFVFLVVMGSVCEAGEGVRVFASHRDAEVNERQVIQLERVGDQVVVQMGNEFLQEMKGSEALDFGDHVPYPVKSYVFEISADMCSDEFHCVSDGLMAMEEVHVTHQRVERRASLKFLIEADMQALILIGDDKGSVARFEGKLIEQ